MEEDEREMEHTRDDGGWELRLRPNRLSRFRKLIWSVTLAMRAERRQQENYCDGALVNGDADSNLVLTVNCNSLSIVC
jgi:hypothetical protein